MRAGKTWPLSVILSAHAPEETKLRNLLRVCVPAKVQTRTIITCAGVTQNMYVIMATQHQGQTARLLALQKHYSPLKHKIAEH
jgi:hypothetical protein